MRERITEVNPLVSPPRNRYRRKSMRRIESPDSFGFGKVRPSRDAPSGPTMCQHWRLAT